MKTMKLISILVVFLFINQLSSGQGNDKNKGQRDKDKQQSENVDKRDHQKDNQGNQNGKNNQNRNDDMKGEKTNNADKNRGGEGMKQENHQGKGHAYGRNKGDMSGREFGMLRSEESKNKMKKKFDEADELLDFHQMKIKTMRQNIDDTKKRNEEKFQSGKISKKTYEENMERIKEAEEIVNNVEEKVRKEKTNVQSARQELK